MEKPTESGYEVFLSFRGPDTRRDIADYLYNSLIRAGIRAYRDNEELPIGEEINPELCQAIKQSEILIPILSKGYAASPSCLMESAQMVECKEKWGRKIVPIFYDVTPAEVRYQTGSYGEAISLHKNKQRFPNETIEKWKTALSKVGDLRGWELKERGKGEFTEEVVWTLLIELKKNNLVEPDHLVEMDDDVDKIMEKIGEPTTRTKIVGIHGMGGVGKTTLATIVYNKLSADFANCCFLSNIRETEIVNLQNQLISKVLRMEWPSINSINEGITEIRKRLSSKKVLLLLDDVDRNTQLQALVGTGECWFGRGSKVIITTRNEEVLKDVDLKHELTEMDFNHSLLLFSKHAFRRDHPPAEYVFLSEKAVEICGRLPLALEIIGSLLAGNDRKFWVDTLEKLKTIPNTEVKSKLNISFEALEPREKEIFLDVCCFFVGFDVSIVTYMWASCKLFPECSLEVLKRKSLMKIVEGNRLWVHDQLRDLGREIVREKANFKPEKQSRVWDHEEAFDVLEMKEGRENVEIMRLKYDHQFQDFFEKEESIRLPNLRYLQVDCIDLDENNVQHFPSTNWFLRNPIVLPRLRWLSWHKFPIFFKFSALSVLKLVILDLSSSEITDEWEGWNHLKMSKDLKVQNLTGCRNLRRTPDLSAHENLKQLILQGCTELVQVDRSIGRLKHLVLLNLRGCGKLETLPDEMGELEALTELIVDGTSITKIPGGKGVEKLETLSAVSCSLLRELPFGNFRSLVMLVLSSSSIPELPNSIEMMKNLRVLRISNSSLEKLPSALGMLEKLEEIDASNCRNLSGEIPSEIRRLLFLRILRLSDTRISNIPKLPESMIELVLTNNLQMRYPDFSNLLNLRGLKLELKYQSASHHAPSLNWIGGFRKLESLWLDCDSLVTLPSDFNLLSKLRNLVLIVNNLEYLPKLSQNLFDLCIHGRGLMEKSINLSYLEKLSRLEVHYCRQVMEIQGLQSLKNLQMVDLCDLPSLVKLPNLTGLKKLGAFWIRECPKLVEVHGQLELEIFHVSNCKSLEKLPDPSSFKHIEELRISGCLKLEEIQGSRVSENLRVFRVKDLPLLEKLPDLTNAKELKELELVHCPRLVEIRGRLESLERLKIYGCGSLQKFFDPSSFKHIEELCISGCSKLEEIQGLEVSENLRVLRVEDLPLLEKLPDLTNAKELKELELVHCPRLVEIRGRLESLERLKIYGCGSLQKISDPSSFKHIEKLCISGCSKLEEIQGLEVLKNLRVVRVEDFPLEKLSDLTNAKELKELVLVPCPRLVETRGGLKSWKGLGIYDCMSLKKCSGHSRLKHIEELWISGCPKLEVSESLRLLDTRISNIPKLPESTIELVFTNNLQMRYQDLSNLLNLRGLKLELKYQSPSHPAPSLNWIGGLRKLESLRLNCDSLVTLHSDFNLLLKLRKLVLIVDNLEYLPKLPQNLFDFRIHDCPKLVEVHGQLELLEFFHVWDCKSLEKLLDPSRFKRIEELWISGCSKLGEIQGLEVSESLRVLVVWDLPLLEKLPNLTTPRSSRSLEELCINGCSKLEEIQRLEVSENLRSYRWEDLPLLEKLPNVTNAKELKELELVHCPCLLEIRGRLESLEMLKIYGCGSLQKFSDPSSFKHIEELCISGCSKLEEIQGLEVSENLRVLRVEDLPLLEKLPDLTNAKELTELELVHCPRLVEIRGRLESLKRLEIYGCRSLQKFSDPSRLKRLENLEIKEM